MNQIEQLLNACEDVISMLEEMARNECPMARMALEHTAWETHKFSNELKSIFKPFGGAYVCNQ